MKTRYNALNSYLKEKFGERTLKICIDGGFTCPNRDGTKGTGGCIFCSEKGSGEHIKSRDISTQIQQHLSSYRGKRANKFIAYFQNFSNTYASIENLKIRYDTALKNDKIVALAVATRPDCITDQIAKLLNSYTKTHYVYVELGLQTANDKSGKILNRGFDSGDFENAVRILSNYDIDVVAHIMVGLPNETFDDIKRTVEFINKQNISGIKIHSTYVVKNTTLEDMYLSGQYTPPTLEEYIRSVVYIIKHISPSLIIHRISGDAPKDLLVAPEWNLHKKWIINGINKVLEQQDVIQGDSYLEN
ncbi:MAG: TIGR01212 family radical SAM protein [Clostridia bacterium]|nr:TIGR01212 family radical SAM protein [Clostridia bacterium]